MTNAGAQAKYYRVDAPISDSLLADHIDGAITLAAQLHNQERSSCAAVDIDHGGPDAVRAVLAAAERLRCAAAGFVLDAGQHNGGHVWLFFEEHHSADDLRALMRDIIEAAGVRTPEVYPDDRDLRLPFGIHRWSGKRGALLVASDAPAIDIDHDQLRALQVFATTYHETADSIVAAAHERQAARRAQFDSSAQWPHFQRESSAIELIHAFNRLNRK